MKTHELLKLNQEDMAAAIKSMKTKECDKHARNFAKITNLDFDKAVITAMHAVLMSEQKAPVAQRVRTDIWALAESEKSGCTEENATIFAMLLLMLIHNKTNEFTNFEALIPK